MLCLSTNLMRTNVKWAIRTKMLNEFDGTIVRCECQNKQCHFMQFISFQCPLEWSGKYFTISFCCIFLSAHKSIGEIGMHIVSSGHHITHHTHHCLHNYYCTATGQRNIMGDTVFNHNLYDFIDHVVCLWSTNLENMNKLHIQKQHSTTHTHWVIRIAAYTKVIIIIIVRSFAFIEHIRIHRSAQQPEQVFFLSLSFCFLTKRKSKYVPQRNKWLKKMKKKKMK